MNNIEKGFICLCVCEGATLHSMITAKRLFCLVSIFRWRDLHLFRVSLHMIAVVTLAKTLQGDVRCMKVCSYEAQALLPQTFILLFLAFVIWAAINYGSWQINVPCLWVHMVAWYI